MLSPPPTISAGGPPELGGVSSWRWTGAWGRALTAAGGCRGASYPPGVALAGDHILISCTLGGNKQVSFDIQEHGSDGWLS